MRFPAQEKYKAVFAVLRQGKSVSEVARSYKSARKTLYVWIKKYQASPSRKKTSVLENSYKRGKDHPRSFRHLLRSRVSRLVAKDPSLSATALSKKLGVGRHGVVNLLSELNLSSRQDREAFKRIYSGPGRLLSDIKGQVVRQVLEEGKKVSQVSAEWAVARKTIYKWINRYQDEGKVEEKYASGLAHPKAFSEIIQKNILGVVSGAPELSIHKLARKLSLS